MSSSSAKFRNTFGTTWRKELWITNVKPATSGTALLRASADGALLALPWQSQGGDGRLAVFPAATVGKLPSPPATIAAHKGAIVDVAWSPFRARVCTVAREPVAKVWDVPAGGLGAAGSGGGEDAVLAATLPHAGCRAASARWHPHVDGLVLTTGSDNALHVWDLAHGATETTAAGAAASLALSSEAHPDAVQSAEWDGEHGSLVVTACKDACCRLWDVRAARGAAACVPCATAGAAHGAKGFAARFLEQRGMVLTLGVDGAGDRTLVLRDTRALARVLATVTVDTGNPYPLVPLYDASTGVLYLASRGTVTYAYEVHAIAPFALPVGRIASRTNHSAVCMAPKTVCDVLRCETARLYALTVGGTIEPVSVAVQRKPGARPVFHEDLFPPVPGTQPAPVSPAAWLDPAAHILTAPQLVSLQPPGVPSIFDIPAAEGGKSREQDEHRTATIATLAADPAAAAALAARAPVTEGPLLFACPPRDTAPSSSSSSSSSQEQGQEQQHGDPATPQMQRRFVKLVHGRIYVFADEESPSSIAWIDANDIVDVVDCAAADPAAGAAPGAFTVVTCEEDGVTYPFVADSEGAKLAWIRSIRSLASAAQKAALSESESESESEPDDDASDDAEPSSTVTAGDEGKEEDDEKEKEEHAPVATTLEVKTPAASPVPGRRSMCLSATSSPLGLRRSPASGRRRTYSSSRSPLPLNTAAAIQSVMYAYLPDTGDACHQYEFSIVNNILYRARILDAAPDAHNDSAHENPMAHSVRLPTTSAGGAGSQQKQQQSQQQPTLVKEKAVEVCHLERILGMMDTEDVFERSLGGASFKIITASCAVHLLASCAEIRAKWVRLLSRGRLEARNRGVFDVRDKLAALQDSAGDDGAFAGEDVEPEDIVLDGPVTVLPPTGAPEAQHWTSVMEDLFVYASPRACVPLAHHALATIATVQAVDNSDPLHEDTDFEVTFKAVPAAPAETDEKQEKQEQTEVQPATMTTKKLMCRCENEDARDMWVQGLEEKERRAVDILEELGIDEAHFKKDPAFRNKYVTMSDVTCGRHRMLLQVGGRRRMRVWNAEVSWRSLNPHNAFVLDTGDVLYVWNGVRSSRVVRGKAFDLANRVRTRDRSAHPQLVTLLQNSAAERACEPFWRALGRSLADVAASVPPDARTPPPPPPPPPGVVHATPAEQDAEGHPIAVYRVGPHLAKPRYHRVRLVAATTDRAPPSSARCLHRNNAYVVDCGTEIYVWVGRLAGEDQRDLALLVANKMLARPPPSPLPSLQQQQQALEQEAPQQQQQQRPAWAVVLRVPQGAEPALFREKFTDFPGTMPIHTYSAEGGAVAHSRLQQSVEGIVRAMQTPAPPEDVPDALAADAEPTGTIARMWRVEAHRAHDYPAAMAGHLFSGDAFVVLYTYRVHDKPMHVLYFWQGRDSRNKEKGVSAMLVRDVAASLGSDHVTQVRLVQGKESLHFVRVLARCARGLVVHRGHYTALDRTAPHLYEVRHRPPFPCKAVETALSAAALNSNHVFLLLEPARAHLTAWLGRACDADERAFALRQLAPDTALRWPHLLGNAAPHAVSIWPVAAPLGAKESVAKEDVKVTTEAVPEVKKEESEGAAEETKEETKEAEVALEEAKEDVKEETEVVPETKEETKEAEVTPEKVKEDVKEESEVAAEETKEGTKEETEVVPEEKEAEVAPEEAKEDAKEETEVVPEETKEETKEAEVAPEETNKETKDEVKEETEAASEETKDEAKEVEVAPEEMKEEAKEEAKEETKEAETVPETKEEAKEVEVAPEEMKEETEAAPEETKEAEVSPEEVKEDVKEESEVAAEETKEETKEDTEAVPETKEDSEAVPEETKEETNEASEEMKEETMDEVKEETEAAPEETKEETEAVPETKEESEAVPEDKKAEVAPEEAKEDVKEEVKEETEAAPEETNEESEAAPEETKEETKEAEVAPEETKEETKEEAKEETEVAAEKEETREAPLECTVVEEEDEEAMDHFFDVLGGRQTYYQTCAGDEPSAIAHNPRLFCLTHTSGAVEADEEPNPSQDDLVAGGTFVVDAFRAVYVWMSSKTAVRTVRRLALTIALEYVHQSTQHHAPDTPVRVVEAFHEPADFCAQFHAWSRSRHAVPRGENLDVVVPAQDAAAVLEAEFNTRYTLADLTGKQLPQGVDPLALEQYLTDDDFEKAFKMGRAEFARLKKWQQDDLKRACGLY